MHVEAFLSEILCGTINHTRRAEITLRTQSELFLTHVFNTAVFLVTWSQATEYPAASQIVCGQLDGHTVSRNDADIELSDFAGHMCEHVVSCLKTDTEACVLERFSHCSAENYNVVFLACFIFDGIRFVF